LDSLQYAAYAKTYRAMMVAVEHRFYGESSPFPELSTKHLRYLSADQALADLAIFISWLIQEYNTESSPVITFGGSYSGALTAWFRLKYPQITIASVASSAPVNAVLDFYQYLQVVDQSLDYFSGKRCNELISEATNQIQQLLKTASGQSRLQSLFNLCAPFSSVLDQYTFMEALMGNWQGVVQYNDETPGSLDITQLCKWMKNGTSPLQTYADIANYFFSGECLDISYNDTIVFLKKFNTKWKWRWLSSMDFSNLHRIWIFSNNRREKSTVWKYGTIKSIIDDVF